MGLALYRDDDARTRGGRGAPKHALRFEDPHGEDPHTGLGIARMIARTTYRSEPELHEGFGQTVQVDLTAQPDDDGVTGDVLRGPGEPGSGQYAIESYLAHHADKLARRFDANTYLRVAHAINTHDVGRGRGGIETALAQFTGPALVAAVDSDWLYPLSHSQQLAAGSLLGQKSAPTRVTTTQLPTTHCAKHQENPNETQSHDIALELKEPVGSTVKASAPRSQRTPPTGLNRARFTAGLRSNIGRAFCRRIRSLGLGATFRVCWTFATCGVASLPEGSDKTRWNNSLERV